MKKQRHWDEWEHAQHEQAMSRLNVFVWLLITAFLWFGLSMCAHADELIQGHTVAEYVNAIGKAENSQKHPYGVRSIKCVSVDECRQICQNSVVNASKRWQKAGTRGNFIVFMGKRYSPPSINPNWVRLVTFFVNHQEKGKI